MNIFEFIKTKIFRLNKGYKETITSQKSLQNQTFSINTFERSNRFFLDEINTWYQGDSTKLLEFYTKARTSFYPSEYIRQRNCTQYFWSQSVDVQKIKRTTANLVRTITSTLCNIINFPDIYCGALENNVENPSGDKNELLKEIIDQNDFIDRLYDIQMRKTLYEGWGAYKININNENDEYPKIRYHNAQDCYFVKEEGDIKAIIFLSYYYNENNKRFILVDTRYTKKIDGIMYSCIDQQVFEELQNSVREVSLSECDFLQDKTPHREFANIPFILGEPCVFYEVDGLENDGFFGRSIFYGKIDALDDYDQALSVASTCIRRSMPKVTYPVESIDTDRNGNAKLPNDFDTDFIAVPNQMTGDGLDMSSATPKVVQPTLHLNIYKDMMDENMKTIAGGVISINDIGLNEQTFFRDSAEAIRERSRQTLYTINYVRKKESRILKSLFNKLIFVYERFWKGLSPTIKDFKDYNIQIRYDKFLSPSKEQKIKAYLPMFQSGAISDEKFVRTIYEDELSDSEMEKEIQELKDRRLLASGINSDGGETFNKTPSFEKNTSPYQDELTQLSDNSGMNNHNRGIKNVKDI